MLNCLIIEDDLAAAALLRHFIGQTEGLHLLDVLDDGIQAANFLRRNEGNVDLIFLDVELPGMSGIELLESQRQLPPVVLVSAREKYALRAFDFQVAHYLLKPVEYGRFLQAIDRVMQLREQQKGQPLDYIFIKENGLLCKLPHKDIRYMEALGDYVKIMAGSKTHTINTTMKNLEEKLKSNPEFIRVHRSYLINVNYLENFDSETAVVGGKVIPIGNKYRPLLQSRLNII